MILFQANFFTGSPTTYFVFSGRYSGFGGGPSEERFSFIFKHQFFDVPNIFIIGGTGGPPIPGRGGGIGGPPIPGSGGGIGGPPIPGGSGGRIGGPPLPGGSGGAIGVEPRKMTHDAFSFHM